MLRKKGSAKHIKRKLKMSYIPERSSSKRAFADVEADRTDRRLLDTDIDRGAKKVKAAGSFDSNYWTKLREVSELRVKRSVLGLRLLQDE